MIQIKITLKELFKILLVLTLISKQLLLKNLIMLDFQHITTLLVQKDVSMEIVSEILIRKLE